MILRTIESDRLTLVAVDDGLIQADLQGRAALAAELSAEVPENWPPDLYQRPAMQFTLDALKNDPRLAGWMFWYLLKPAEEASELVGLCGFKGRPDERGSVEIGYSLLPQYRSLGYATEAVSRLVAWAFTHQNVTEVCAETLPHLRQSIRVLEKNGFQLSGAGSEYGVIRYAIRKSNLR